ncbi:MAG: PrsW family intramembrane metalloprotease [Deltaproteobacteria bacterium]|nr:PrsW family intramembrane metalloprotease [Deltaproteobacteria bacterium]
MYLLMLFFLAVSPGIAISFYVYHREQDAKKSLWPVFASFVFGIGGFYLAQNAGPVFVILLQKIRVFEIIINSPFKSFFYAFIIVGFLEELTKFLFVRAFLFKSRYFVEPYDGVFYCIMVAMGFATVENIQYCLWGDVHLALMRMATAVPAHAFFASLMGYFLGLARFNNSARFQICGLLSAALLHGIYNYFLIQKIYSGLMLGSFAALGVGYYLFRRILEGGD